MAETLTYAYEERLAHHKNLERAKMILQHLRGWERDRNEPPSLRDGYQRPTNDDIWARAVLAVEKEVNP